MSSGIPIDTSWSMYADLDDVPEFCQQFGCHDRVATWCPLCRAFFCARHDELYPRRMHDCLRGKAEAA
ncbi:MAG TPA: hypothetical protein VFB50_05625 [Chloroflexota bacterium]|nr:hypothetical protein [Chloroflexota bacterium]